MNRKFLYKCYISYLDCYGDADKEFGAIFDIRTYCFYMW